MVNDMAMEKPTIHPPPGAHHARDESHLLREVMRTYSALVLSYARCTGGTASRIGLMRLLAVVPSPLGTNDLARRLGIDPAAVTRQLKDLEAEGWVTRRAHPGDGRRTVVKLTKAGRQAFRRMHDQGHAYERALAAEVSQEDVESALRVLRAMQRVVLRSVSDDEQDLP
jgi:DNA-binding MarR family transcriptional regulator